MRNRNRLRAALVGGHDGPSGWTLSNGLGGRTTLSLEALLCLEHQLRADGDPEAADDLHRQVTTLARVAEAWRHRDRDRDRELLEEVAS
jgi:hypothetical protein